MLQQPVHHPCAWQAETIGEAGHWRLPLPQSIRDALAAAIHELRQRPRPITDLRLDGSPCAECRPHLAEALHRLEHDPGFVVLHGLPDGDYTREEFKAMYWLIGQMLGRPFAQNVQGTLLYDVADYGQDVRQGARFSVTNAESSFHTDNAFGDQILDYVGLLCLNPARAGGLSQLVSGYSVHNRLLAEAPDALALLYQPFHVDRRGGTRPGEPPTAQVPVITWNGSELLFRYFRAWIEAGHEKTGQPLTGTQVAALDVLDQIASRPEMRVEFALRPGDMFFINNRWLLHNRTAFEDFAEPERRRHLVRLWLRAY